MKMFIWLSAIVMFVLGCGANGGTPSNGGTPGPAPSTLTAPTGVVAEAGDGQATVSWSPVPEAVTYNLYVASVSGVTKSHYGSLADGTKQMGVTSQANLRGLANRKAYYFTVTALNAGGESPESIEVSAAPGVFRATGSMAVPRVGHTATLLPNGKVLIAGGGAIVDNNPIEYTSAELYDPVTRAFSPTGSMTIQRRSHTATLLLNGQVLIVGGSGSVLSPGSAELYDPSTGVFSALGSHPIARFFSTATLLPNGKVLITGQDDDGCCTSGPLPTSAELYDPATATFNAIASKTLAGNFGHATLLMDGKVLFAEFQAELYDPATDAFVTTGKMIAGYNGPTATLLPNGQVLIVGGTDRFGTVNAELYDPVIGAFKTTKGPTSPRRWHTATLLSNGKVLIAGGDNLSSNPTNSNLSIAELYDPDTGFFSVTRKLLNASDFRTATLLPNGKVLITGGIDAFQNVVAYAELFG